MVLNLFWAVIGHAVSAQTGRKMVRAGAAAIGLGALGPLMRQLRHASAGTAEL